MNLQKIKETLKENLKALCSLNKNQFGDVVIDGIPCYPVMVELVGRTREALAELEAEKPPVCTRCGDPLKVGVCENCLPDEAEKPEEDAVNLARSIRRFTHISGTGGDLVHARADMQSAQLIQQYAESYHAKKCAECKKYKICKVCGYHVPNKLEICTVCGTILPDAENRPEKNNV